MPASPKIDTPTEFAQWAQTKMLFDDGTLLTETHVTDGYQPGVRLAYGKSPDGFWFFISMTPAEEPIFWEAYRAWRNRNQTDHRHTVTLNILPPSCGTPNTPPCELQVVADPIGSVALETPSSNQDVKAA